MVTQDALDETGSVVYIEVPDGDGCSPCLAAKSNALPYLPWHQFVALAPGNAVVWQSFLTARAIVCGDQRPDWNQQEVLVVNANICDAGVDMDGWLEKQNAAHGVTPHAMGLVADASRLHPITERPISIFWTPKPGPLLTMRICKRQSAERTRSAMGREVYASQVEDTCNHHSKEFQQPCYFQVAAGELLTHAEFATRLQILSGSAGGQGSTPGAAGNLYGGQRPAQLPQGHMGPPQVPAAVMRSAKLFAFASIGIAKKPMAGAAFNPVFPTGSAALPGNKARQEPLRVAPSRTSSGSPPGSVSVGHAGFVNLLDGAAPPQAVKRSASGSASRFRLRNGRHQEESQSCRICPRSLHQRWRLWAVRKIPAFPALHHLVLLLSRLLQAMRVRATQAWTWTMR